MTNIRFHNDTKTLNHIWYESHHNLITSLCIEFDKTDQIESIVKKYLGPPLKIKTLKDPLKPKRAMSAYLYYCAEKRPKLLDETKALGEKIVIGNIAKALGALWSKLEDTEKTNWNKMASVDRERYKDEMETYNA